jgi:type II secretory pathway pseudopilin PulG
MTGNERGRSVFEALLALALIAAAVMLAMERFISSAKSLKETALSIELGNLRRAVVHHAMLEKELPGTLSELVTDNIEIPSPDFQGESKIIVVGRFVEAASVDKEGRPLDPFGSAYGYDPATGRVWSSTPEYGNW